MAPLTVQHLAGNTYIIPSPANMGVWVDEGRATLVDSGNDDDAGRKIIKLFAEQGWTLERIINTHSNADHIGGNAFLTARTGCTVLATSIEAAFIRHPELEPSLLYGAFPMRSLRSKFLQARETAAVETIEQDGPIPGTALRAFSLPGHFLGMIGVETPDSVLFLADSLFSEAILEKYPLFFLYDIRSHLETLQRLESMSASWYVPSHAAPVTDITRLLAVNRARITETLALLENLCHRLASFDDILAGVCDAYRIELNASQYVLVGSTIRSYLSYLVDEGRLDMVFSAGTVRWQKTA